ncbi:MAG: transporter [Nevskia sp.]|nr:transporter [Nevskia sp.]
MDRRRLAVTLAGAAAFLTLYAPQSLLPLLRSWLGKDAALAGLVISAGTFGVALAAPFAGMLADRFGRRRVIVSAAFLTAIPTLLMAAAPTPPLLLAGRFAEGIFLPGIFAVTVAYAADEWPAVQARAVTALYVAGTIGGGFCGRLLAGVVGEFAGWRIALVALACLQFLVAWLIRRWLPTEQRYREPAAVRVGVFELLRDPRLRGAYAAGCAILFALVGGFTYITLRLAEAPFELGPAALSALFTVYLVGVVVTPMSGRILNRLGHARTLTLAWSVAIGGLLLTLAAQLPVIVVGLCLFSGGLFIAQTAATSFVGEAAAHARATAVGLYVTCYYLGGSVGGVLPAPLFERVGWPGVVALIALAAVFSVTMARRAFRLQPAAAHPVEVSGEAL